MSRETPVREGACRACNGTGGGENRMGGPEWTCAVCGGRGKQPVREGETPLELLKVAQPEFCSMKCPSVFRGPDSARHTPQCLAMQAAIVGAQAPAPQPDHPPIYPDEHGDWAAAKRGAAQPQPAGETPALIARLRRWEEVLRSQGTTLPAGVMREAADKLEALTTAEQAPECEQCLVQGFPCPGHEQDAPPRDRP